MSDTWTPGFNLWTKGSARLVGSEDGGEPCWDLWAGDMFVRRIFDMDGPSACREADVFLARIVPTGTEANP